MYFEDAVWPGEGPKRDRGVTSDVDQLSEREHGCTSPLPRVVKLALVFFDNHHHLYKCQQLLSIDDMLTSGYNVK